MNLWRGWQLALFSIRLYQAHCLISLLASEWPEPVHHGVDDLWNQTIVIHIVFTKAQGFKPRILREDVVYGGQHTAKMRDDVCV